MSWLRQASLGTAMADLPLPFDRETFLAQRTPERGNANPERMTRPVWQWLVQTRETAHTARNRFGVPNPDEAGPGWSFARFGCSRTVLPDGRVLHVAGEHEDFYDPDFHIYNDVIVRNPDGAIEIFGYPEDVFPPTDFHSATLSGDRLLLVGGLGYQDRRRPGATPVFELDLATLAITARAVGGAGPSWFHRHAAHLSEDGTRVVLTSGNVLTPAGDLLENHTDWAIDLRTWSWLALRDHAHQLWSVARADGGRIPFDDYLTARTLEEAAQHLRDSGFPFDPAACDALLRPTGIAHAPAPSECTFDDEFELPRPGSRSGDSARLAIGNAIVRYVGTGRAVELRVDGNAGPELGRRLAEDLAAKLTRLLGVPCTPQCVREA